MKLKKELIWNLSLLFVGCSWALFKNFRMLGFGSYNLNRTIGWSNPYWELTQILLAGFLFGIALIVFRYIFIAIFRWIKNGL
jgi:hypothetical protein